jgi:hypothetical protein
MLGKDAMKLIQVVGSAVIGLLGLWVFTVLMFSLGV